MRKAGLFLTIAGAVLILSALSLFCYGRLRDAEAGRQAQRLLAAAEDCLQQPQAAAAEQSGGAGAAPQAVKPAQDAQPDPELPVVELEGYGCVGVLRIPALELELPVLDDWDDARLEIAPCRQFGSSRTDDLVIAAHNYSSHFGQLQELTEGALVLFTDMDGVVNAYTVDRIAILQPTEVEAVQNSGYDLVLYTCTKGGASRVVVFCTRTEPAGGAAAPAAER